jgi:hypothetical protein
MNHDQTLRAALIVAVLAVLPIGIYYRLESQSTREKLDRRQEGLFILATLRPIGATFWLGLIAWRELERTTRAAGNTGNGMSSWFNPKTEKRRAPGIWLELHVDTDPQHPATHDAGGSTIG